jgi:hypothetical protein
MGSKIFVCIQNELLPYFLYKEISWILIPVRFGILKMVGPKKARFLAKNQYTRRKPFYFENTGSASFSKIGHDFRK